MRISEDRMPDLGFVRITPPHVVYHMTDRQNLESILHDERIRTFHDFVAFFFPKPEDVIKYIHLSQADIGRKYYDFDGLIHTAPPLDHTDTVVLELIPRYNEPTKWFRETSRYEQFTNQIEARIRRDFDSCRIAHYGDFKYDTRNVKIHELSQFDEWYPYQNPYEK